MVVGVGVDVTEGGNEGACFSLLAVLLLLTISLLLLLLGAILVLVLVVVILALGFVLVGAVGGEVTWLATIKAVVVVPSLIFAVVVEAHEPPHDQGKLLIIKNLQLLL